jgi:hypothetical protein
MRNFYTPKALVGLLVAMLLLGISASRIPAAVTGLADLSFPGLRADQAADVPQTGLYTGQVVFQGVYTGEFDDNLQPNEFTGGYIDLALDLEQIEDEVNGYISLDHTLVFTQEHIVDDQAFGPWVSGSFDGTTLHLVSDKFTWQVASGRVLPEDGRILPDRQATRQFSLTTTEITNNGARLVGEYRETFWGLSPQPITIVGDFTMIWVGQTRIELKEVFLPLISTK